MSITPADFLASAKGLAALPAEADGRSAVSRAYYAAFHAANRVIPERYEPSPARGGSSHEAVIAAIQAFSRSLDPGRTEAAKISAIRKIMLKADFHG